MLKRERERENMWVREREIFVGRNKRERERESIFCEGESVTNEEKLKVDFLNDMITF